MNQYAVGIKWCFFCVLCFEDTSHFLVFNHQEFSMTDWQRLLTGCTRLHCGVLSIFSPPAHLIASQSLSFSSHDRSPTWVTSTAWVPLSFYIKTQLSVCFHIPLYFSLCPMPWFLDNLRFIAVSSAVRELHSYSQGNKTMTNLVDDKWYEQPHSRILKSNSLPQKASLFYSFPIIFHWHLTHPWLEKILWLCLFIQVTWEKGSPSRICYLSETELKWLSSNGGWSEFLIQEHLRNHKDCLELAKALMPSVLAHNQNTVSNFIATFVNKFLPFHDSYLKKKDF